MKPPGISKRVRFRFVGPILDDRLKEKLLKPWKSAHSSHFRVCPSVRTQATGHTFWPRNLIFGLNDPWDMRKKRIFLFSKFAHFISAMYRRVGGAGQRRNILDMWTFRMSGCFWTRRPFEETISLFSRVQAPKMITYNVWTFWIFWMSGYF